MGTMEIPKWMLEKIWMSNSERMCRISTACAQLMASRNSSAGIPGDHRIPANPHKVALGPLLITPFTRAGG